MFEDCGVWDPGLGDRIDHVRREDRVNVVRYNSCAQVVAAAW